MMTSDIENEQKIKEWAETYQGGKFKRFIGSDTLQSLYVKHNMPLKVKDCIVDAKARLTLVIVKQVQRKPIQLCDDCFKKVCGEECGAENYSERYPRAYIGGDETGTIKIGVAPFKDKTVDELQEDEVYVIEGTITEYNKKLEINVDTVATEDGSVIVVSGGSGSSGKESANSEVEPSEDNAEAIESVKDALELFDGEVPESKFNQLTNALKVADLKKALTTLNVELVDGIYRVKQ